MTSVSWVALIEAVLVVKPVTESPGSSSLYSLSVSLVAGSSIALAIRFLSLCISFMCAFESLQCGDGTHATTDSVCVSTESVVARVPYWLLR